jgi:hypothetical protein
MFWIQAGLLPLPPSFHFPVAAHEFVEVKPVSDVYRGCGRWGALLCSPRLSTLAGRQRVCLGDHPPTTELKGA